MTTMQITVPDKLVSEVDHLVESEWFADRGQVLHLALAEFVHRYHFSLVERFQEVDIEWALRRKKSVG